MSRELRTIVERFERLSADGGRAVLATVVDVQGSSYRLPGARMLVDEAGATCGTVSGGCLEADLLERARRVSRTGAAEVFVYDTTATDDTVFGLNMGCRGVIRILLEPAEEALLGFLRHRLQSRHAGAVATVVATAGEPGDGVCVVARLMVDERGATSRGCDRDVHVALAEACAAALDERSSRCRTFDFGEAFVEVVAAPVPLVVFGAGHDAVPLVRLAKEIGWRVTLVDHRPAVATREQFSPADEIVVARPESAAEHLAIDDTTAAVLMTHNYAHDLELLGLLLASPARYVGVLGPRSRTDQLLEDLARGGAPASSENLARLYAPIGIDIGAEAPEEIALSIVAEIRAVLTGRRGGMLRDRAGAIHGQAELGIVAGGDLKHAATLR